MHSKEKVVGLLSFSPDLFSPSDSFHQGAGFRLLLFAKLPGTFAGISQPHWFPIHRPHPLLRGLSLRAILSSLSPTAVSYPLPTPPPIPSDGMHYTYRGFRRNTASNGHDKEFPEIEAVSRYYPSPPFHDFREGKGASTNSWMHYAALLKAFLFAKTGTSIIRGMGKGYFGGKSSASRNTCIV